MIHNVYTHTHTDLVHSLKSVPSCASLPPLVSCPDPHPRREEKGSDYNMTSRPTLEGRNQHTIVSDHMLTNAIYGILSMPRGPNCGAYIYSDCAVIGHFTCQTAYITGSDGCRIVTRPFFSGRVGSRHETIPPFLPTPSLIPRSLRFYVTVVEKNRIKSGSGLDRGYPTSSHTHA